MPRSRTRFSRSEEHTSELQSPCNLVCRLLLEKKKHQIVLDAERERLVARRGHLRDAVFDLALCVELLGERAEADDHPDLAVLEEPKPAVRAIGLAPLHLRDVVAVGGERGEGALAGCRVAA